MNSKKHLALRFLHWFCPESLYESIEGDLLEQFDIDINEVGEKKAKRKLFWNSLKFLRPGIILRNKFSVQINRPLMIRNYITVAYRNLIKHKLHAFINIVGLSLGIAACSLIGVYVADELSFERFHEKSDKLFRVIADRHVKGTATNKGSHNPIPLAAAIKDINADVESAFFLWNEETVVKNGDDIIEAKLIRTSPDFFSALSFLVIAGKATGLLHDPLEIIITREAARRYFNTEDPIEKVIQIKIDTSYHDSNFVEFKIVAVVENPPANSSIQFDLIIPEMREGNWQSSGWETYLALRKGASQKTVSDNIRDLFYKNGDFRNYEITIELEPISQMHFNTDTLTPYTTTNPKHVVLLVTIGILILLLAMITFTTLTLSQSTSRAKEVGVRKTMGAAKKQLINQFYVEAMLVACLSFMIGLALIIVMLPTFNQITGKAFSVALFRQSLFWVISISGLLLTVLLSGSYPALFMSKFNPASVVRNEFKFVSKQQLIMGLTTFQVALSFIFLTTAFVIYWQTNFIASKDLGFAKDYIVRISLDKVWRQGRATKSMLETELAKESTMKGIAASWEQFGKLRTRYNYHPIKSDDQEVFGNVLRTSQEFPSLFELTLAQGNYFSKDHPGAIVNEAFVKAFGWKDPIGRNISMMLMFDEPIVGVVKDFHYESLHQSVQPMAILADRTFYSNIYVSFSGGVISSNLQVLKNAWNKIHPDIPFQYTFMDDDIQQHYESETRWQKIMTYASVLALLISCLGILGMANLTAARKTKEIGIRKVMGASVHSILALLSKDYVKLILISFFIAFPLAHYFLSQWLNGFAYRIEIQWWMYVFPGLCILTIALIAVCGQSLKAALVNPVETLKYE